MALSVDGTSFIVIAAAVLGGVLIGALGAQAALMISGGGRVGVALVGLLWLGLSNDGVHETIVMPGSVRPDRQDPRDRIIPGPLLASLAPFAGIASEGRGDLHPLYLGSLSTSLMNERSQLLGRARTFARLARGQLRSSSTLFGSHWWIHDSMTFPSRM